MKQIVVIVSFIGLNLILISCEGEKQNPRVIIFTDINIDKGDPDDRQSLIHLLWYADELDIRGIIPDRWDAGGYEACQLAIDNYAIDFQNYQWSEKGYPLPEDIRKTVANNAVEANSIFQSALGSSEKDPLYVLVWGNLELCQSLLSKSIENLEKIRLITIGTGPMLEKTFQIFQNLGPNQKPCEQLNWNGFGRNHLYENRDFHALWWIEMNWTYSGMFEGDEPAEMFAKLVNYGDMGAHIKEVVKNHPWAQYF